MDRNNNQGNKQSPESHQIFGAELINFPALEEQNNPSVPDGNSSIKMRTKSSHPQLEISTVDPETTRADITEEMPTSAKRAARGHTPPGANKTSAPERALSSTPPPPLDRRRVGRYEVIYPMAAGGMASVHLGRLSGLAGFERLVAIKIIHPHLSNQSVFVDMFLDEARLAAQIHHPNVGEILEVGNDEGLLYMVGELVEGQNLRKLIVRAQKKGVILSQPLVADILAKVCRGLHAAHELHGPNNEALNLVHRDVSPRNIMVSYTGEVKLIDFGIVHAQGRLSHTEVGLVKGKTGYVSPEQSRGENPDRRSDIFSVGVTLYLLLTGSLPFEGKTGLHRVEKLLKGDFPPPSKLNPKVRPDLERVVLKAMNVNPYRRYQTAAELAYDLEGFTTNNMRGDHVAELADLMHRFFAKDMRDHKKILRHHRLKMGEESVSFNVNDTTDYETGRFKKVGIAMRQPSSVEERDSDRDEITTVSGIRRINGDVPTPMSIDENTATRTASTPGPQFGPSPTATRILLGGMTLIAVLLLIGVGAISYKLFNPTLKPLQTAPSPAPKNASPAPPLPAQITLTLSVSESAYSVELDGAPVGQNLSVIDLNADAKRHELKISKEGFVSYSSIFIADRNKEIDVKLKPDINDLTENGSRPEPEAHTAPPAIPKADSKSLKPKRKRRVRPSLQESPYQ